MKIDSNGSIRSPRPILNARAQELLHYSEKMALHEAVAEAVDHTVRLKIDPG